MERRIGKYERLAIERNERDLALAMQPGGHPRGLWFDEAAGNRVVRFIERYCRHHKGEWAGQLLKLRDWQHRDILRPVFGWMRADGTRRFRTAWIEIARKNGKTTKAGGVGLYLTVGDGEAGAEVYCTATKEDQAKILWRDAAAMVKSSPDLKRFVTEFKAQGGRLYCERLGSFMRPLGADSKTLDGLNPHGHLPDEVHAHKDAGVWNVLDTGMGARRQPLTMGITTAGTFDPTSIGWQKHEYATQVLEGGFEDDSFFAFICAIDDEDDPFDPANWGKANPNLGISVKESYLQGQALKAQREPSFYNEFLRLHLNRWTQQVTRWIQPERWRDCDPIGPEAALERRQAREDAFAGRECWGGLDLSQRLDLTAAVFAFKDDEDNIDLVCRFWLPEATIKEQERKGRKHYAAWAREGWITPTPGEVIDYGFIRREMNELAKKFRICEVAYDPHDATQIATELAEQDGITMVEHRQGFISMSEPAKNFEKRAVAKTLRHGGNPVLAWAVGNALVRKDPAGNIKPDKEHAKDKIDPVVAAVMACGRAELGGGSSPYTGERGLLSL